MLRLDNKLSPCWVRLAWKMLRSAIEPCVLAAVLASRERNRAHPKDTHADPAYQVFELGVFQFVKSIVTLHLFGS
jgi:hypothetical protein